MLGQFQPLASEKISMNTPGQVVSPAKAGIHGFTPPPPPLDPRFRVYDEHMRFFVYKKLPPVFEEITSISSSVIRVRTGDRRRIDFFESVRRTAEGVEHDRKIVEHHPDI